MVARTTNYLSHSQGKICSRKIYIMPHIRCFTNLSGPVNTPYSGMFHMFVDSLLSLLVSLIELLTDSITLIKNAIIVKYYWQQFSIQCLQHRVKVSTNYLAHENCELVIWRKSVFFGSASSEVLTFLWESRTQNCVFVSCSFKSYCKLHKLTFTWVDAMMDIRVSG